MSVSSAELLGRLAGGVRPVADADGPARATGGPLRFDDMLTRARAGVLRTGLPVRVPLGLRPPVLKADLDLLSERTDLAQAEGIRRALIEVGGRTFRVDVDRRAIIDAPDAHRSAVGGIDGAVLEGIAVAGAADGVVPARVVRNASLLDALASVRQDAD